MAVLVEITQNCIAENARVAQDQGEYQKRYNGLVERYEKAKARFDEVTEGIAERSAKGERLRREASPLGAGFIRTIEAQREPVGAKAARPCACARTSTSMCVGGGVR